MAKPRVKLNSKEVRGLLNSPGTQAQLKERADRIAAAAGDGFEASVSAGGTRARARVTAVTYRARVAEAKSGALSKALDAGR